LTLIATEETAVVFGSIEQVRIGGDCSRASILLPPVFGAIFCHINALRIGALALVLAPDAAHPQERVLDLF
jgi:hypothetical protein